MRFVKYMVPSLIFLLCSATRGYSSCNTPPPRQVTVTVESCSVVNPRKQQKLIEFSRRYPKSFVESYQEQAANEAEKIVESYRGAVIEGTEEDGIMRKYFYSNRDKNICAKFKKGSLIEAVVDSACCDGDPNPPCYLGFSVYVVRVSDTLKEK